MVKLVDTKDLKSFLWSASSSLAEGTKSKSKFSYNYIYNYRYDNSKNIVRYKLLKNDIKSLLKSINENKKLTI